MNPKDTRRYPTLLEQLEQIHLRPVCWYCGLVNPAPQDEWTQEHPSCKRAADRKAADLHTLKHKGR